DDDLLPSDPLSIVVVVIDNPALALEDRPAQDELEAGRPQPTRALRMRKGIREGRQARAPPVDGQLDVPGDPPRLCLRIDPPGLERRDLSHIEHIEDVEARP